LAKQQRNRFVVVSYALTFAVLAIFIARYAAHRISGQGILSAPWTTNIWLPLLLASIAAIVLSAKRRAVAALCTLAIGMLLATWCLSRGLSWMDPQLSARGAITASGMDTESLRAADVFVYDVPRGIRYGLNFYLRREIPEWTSGAQGLVFSSWKGQSVLQARGYECQQHIVFPAAFLCKSPGSSAGHVSRGGQPQ
jgi:hypothetical protein